MSHPVIRVGLLGLGTVGAGVAEIIHRHRKLIAQRAGVELRVVRALVRNGRKKRKGPAGKVETTTKPNQVLAAGDVDVVAELLGGIKPARGYIEQALANAKPVVTANKAVLAAHGSDLLKAARRAESDIYFEAAVAGGIPIIRTLREGLASDRITSIRGILNGTTNYILGRMEAGDDYAAALKEAQRLGYAEADPTLDVDGSDAADKLTILMLLAYGRATTPAAIARDGITDLVPEVLADARQLGYRVKLIANAQRVRTGAGDRIDAWVAPTLIPDGDVLSTVPGAQNAVAIESDALGPSLYQGAGAGGLPTGSAVVSDLIEAARNLKAGVHSRVITAGSRSAPRLLPSGQSESAYYLRLEVADEPGVLASVANMLARSQISLATVIQRGRAAWKGDPVPVVVTTHPTAHRSMERVLQKVGKLRALRGRLNVVRIGGQ